jgi:hypothetical protein
VADDRPAASAGDDTVDVTSDVDKKIACSECGRLQDQHICSRCIKAFEDWSITG